MHRVPAKTASDCKLKESGRLRRAPNSRDSPLSISAHWAGEMIAPTVPKPVLRRDPWCFSLSALNDVGEIPGVVSVKRFDLALNLLDVTTEIPAEVGGGGEAMLWHIAQRIFRDTTSMLVSFWYVVTAIPDGRS